MGKKRHTAKTGDKGLYKSRFAANDAGEDRSGMNVDDDPVYNEVDRFHNDKDKDYLLFDRKDDNNSESDDVQEEGVMDLGVVDSDGEDNTSSDESDEEQEMVDSDVEDEAAPLSSSDDEEDEVQENIRDWGRKKSAYYNGDTADLEIGQGQEDAILEEQAAKQVQAARFQNMTEEDFLLSDSDDQADGADEHAEMQERGLIASRTDLSKLSAKEKSKLLDRKHPEFLPLLSHFSPMVRDFHSKTSVVTKAVFFGEAGTANSIGATISGQRYLLLKALMQASAALNLAVYLLFKTENAEKSGDSIDPTMIQNHPVMHYLQKLNALIQYMEDGIETKVGDLADQLEKLVQAAKLIDGSNGESDDESMYDEYNDEHLENTESVKTGSEIIDSLIAATVPDVVFGDASSEDERAIHKNVLTEARFGLRPNELYSMKETSTKRPRHKRLVVADAGDDDDDVGDGQQKSVVQSLSVTLNSIEQRADSKKKTVAPLVEHLDDHVEDDGELRRGLEMMESELGKASDEDVEEQGEDPELDDYDDDDFYARVSKRSGQRKSDRKDMYSVAPKFPRVEGEIDGERAIGKMILKNRGLVAHKAKINRNPRVKKREQFRKAIVRRKGAVQDVRTNEGHKYGGEETGIKSGLSRSRKLGR